MSYIYCEIFGLDYLPSREGVQVDFVRRRISLTLLFLLPAAHEAYRMLHLLHLKYIYQRGFPSIFEWSQTCHTNCLLLEVFLGGVLHR